MALPGWKTVGYLSGLSKEGLLALIAVGWTFEQAVEYLMHHKNHNNK